MINFYLAISKKGCVPYPLTAILKINQNNDSSVDLWLQNFRRTHISTWFQPKKNFKKPSFNHFQDMSSPKKATNSLRRKTPRRHQETWRLRNELAQQQQQGTCQARQDHAHVPIVVQQGEEAREETSAISNRMDPRDVGWMWDMKTTQKI